MNRQIREAVRIRRRGGAGSILNSKAESNRCHIPRLVVEEEEEDTRVSREQREKEEDEGILRSLEDMDDNWEKLKARERELREKKRMVVEQEHNGGARKRRRRIRYPLLKEDWGQEDEMVEQEDVQSVPDNLMLQTQSKWEESKEI